MFPTLIVAVLLAPPPTTGPATGPTGEAVYEGLPIDQRERFTANWERAVREAEIAIPFLERDATAARLQIRFAADKRAAKAKADGLVHDISTARQRVARIKRNNPPLLMQLEVAEKGSIGTAPTIVTFQRLGDDEALCKLSYSFQTPDGDIVRNEPIALVRMPGLFEGVADQRRVDVDGDGLWRVTGTHTYTTAIGASSTVPVVEPYTDWPVKGGPVDTPE